MGVILQNRSRQRSKRLGVSQSLIYIIVIIYSRSVVPIHILMHYSMTFCCINSLKSTLNTWMMHKINRKNEGGMFNPSCTQLSYQRGIRISMLNDKITI